MGNAVGLGLYPYCYSLTPETRQGNCPVRCPLRSSGNLLVEGALQLDHWPPSKIHHYHVRCQYSVSVQHWGVCRQQNEGKINVIHTTTSPIPQKYYFICVYNPNNPPPYRSFVKEPRSVPSVCGLPFQSLGTKDLRSCPNHEGLVKRLYQKIELSSHRGGHNLGGGAHRISCHKTAVEHQDWFILTPDHIIIYLYNYLFCTLNLWLYTYTCTALDSRIVNSLPSPQSGLTTTSWPIKLFPCRAAQLI